jgi:hypothetical protein
MFYAYIAIYDLWKVIFTMTIIKGVHHCSCTCSPDSMLSLIIEENTDQLGAYGGTLMYTFYRDGKGNRWHTMIYSHLFI